MKTACRFSFLHNAVASAALYSTSQHVDLQQLLAGLLSLVLALRLEWYLHHRIFQEFSCLRTNSTSHHHVM